MTFTLTMRGTSAPASDPEVIQLDACVNDIGFFCSSFRAGLRLFGVPRR
jgi:hypothetical protein